MRSFRVIGWGVLGVGLVAVACSSSSSTTPANDTGDAGQQGALDAALPIDAGPDAELVGPTGVGSVGIAAASPNVSLVIGSTAQLALTLTRKSFSGALTATVTGLPAGVTVAPVPIASGAAAASLTFVAAASATPGASSVTLHVADASGKITTTTPLALNVRGVPGTLDTSFGTAGVVTAAALGSTANGVSVQSSGAVIVTSVIPDPVTGGNGDKDVLASRFTTAGVLDTTFGTAGSSANVIPSSCAAGLCQGRDDGTLVAVMADDSIVVLPLTLTSTFIAPHSVAYHMSKTGTFDAAFAGGAGYVELSMTVSQAVSSGGKLLVAGTASSKPMVKQVDVATATIDALFGGFYVATSGATGLSLIPGGGVYVGGNKSALSMGTTVITPFVGKFLPTGSLDIAYGTSGVTTNGLTSPCRGVATTKAGDALCVGDTPVGQRTVVTLTHVTSGGVDAAYRFPKTPSAILLGDQVATAIALAVGGDDKPIILASTMTGGVGSISLVRANPDGAPDLGFNGVGYLTTTLGGAAAGAIPIGMALTPDGKLVVVGSLDGALMISRFWL